MLTLLCCVQGHSFHLGCDWKVPVPRVQSTITWHCVWVFFISDGIWDMETDRISEPRMIQGLPLKINRQTVLHWSRLFISASLCKAFHQIRLLRKVQHTQLHRLPQSQTERERRREACDILLSTTTVLAHQCIFTQRNIRAHLEFRPCSEPFLSFRRVNGGVRFQMQAIWWLCGLLFSLICWTQLNNPKALQGWITMIPSLEAGSPKGVTRYSKSEGVT